MIAPELDLVATGWSVPGSRLYLADRGDGVCLYSAEYERAPQTTTLAVDIAVFDGDGRALGVTAVLPERVVFDGDVSLTFAGPGALSLASESGDPVRVTLRPGMLPMTVLAAERADRDGVLHAGGAQIIFDVDGGSRLGEHARHLADTAELCRQWAARCPQVRADLEPMAVLCWWVLGFNTLTLRGRTEPAVVPSLTGYVAVWQWDAYFIARGLRHGDLDLARTQLQIALQHASPDGQLPDVVHDDGVLASSDDLPPADVARLREHASPAADPQAPVPLTKPPLAAWAVLALAECGADPAWVQWALAVALDSQRWWFAGSDTDGDGVPEYGHPYSSGLDDSPVFDAELPLVSPDLLGYLVLQDHLLAQTAAAAGDADLARECRLRADATRTALLGLWHQDRFLAGSASGPVPVDAITGLLPVLAPGLPEHCIDAIVAAIGDPQRYGTRFGLPTVAVDDPRFDRARMWRGPTWVNTNVLVVEGLRRAGRHECARELAERTLAAVIAAGGPFEYLDPFTAQRVPSAVQCFSWSAALFIDLAVALSQEQA